MAIEIWQGVKSGKQVRFVRGLDENERPISPFDPSEEMIRIA